MSKTENTFLILGNQLFPPSLLKKYKETSLFFMAEDYELCTYQKHHKQKIMLFLCAMRSYADELSKNGFNIKYSKLTPKNTHKNFEDKLLPLLKKTRQLISFEIEDKFFEKKIQSLCEEHNVKWTLLPSPMFLCSRDEFYQYNLASKKPFMKTFYEKKRKDWNILIDKSNKPIGGKWSFDTENRSKLPKNIEIPSSYLSISQNNPHLKSVQNLIKQIFSDHPGDEDNFWYHVTRKDYLKEIDRFLLNKIENFGKYQDAITAREPFLFHSLLTPGLNLGLITPQDVIAKTLKFFEKNKQTPLNSIEGFIRQVIGWREFVRGIYQEYSDTQDTKNFWQHKRKMKACWYDGTTGIPPLDDAIKKAVKYGYNHHIERLMILSNIMLTTEIHPKQVYNWFMEMYVDSSDWVMGPNVYGMGQFSDGGIFATKPYISGSNYILKMSDYKKNQDWCTIVDGLYWQFIDRKKSFFQKNPRMSLMVSRLEKMDSHKKTTLFKAAESFRKLTTFSS